MRGNWACRLGSRFLWASLGLLIGIIGVALALPFVASTSGDAGDIMLSILQVGFALMLAAFLLGVGCHLVEGRVGRATGGR